MFFRRQKKVNIRLSRVDARILFRIMIWFRNELLAQDKPVEDVDSVILKLGKALGMS